MLKIFLILLLFFSNACRFVVPGSSETAALESKGTFKAGAPSWAKLPKEKSNVLPARAGIMNQTHTIPSGMAMSSSANASPTTAAHVGRGFTEEAKGEVEILETEKSIRKTGSPSAATTSVQVQENVKSADNSVLGRIEHECPGVEKTVVDALKTESSNDRIRKYLSLTRHCPYSSEIWVLLAQEYHDLRRLADTRRCLQAALAINPDHVEAKKMYDSLSSSSGSAVTR